MLVITLLAILALAVDRYPTSATNDSRSLDLRIPLARVPSVSTYYVCQQFQVPSEQSYDAVQFEPLIDNKDLVHHILVFGCDFEMDNKGPHPCGGIDNRCRTWLVKWDLGMEEVISMPRDVGVRFGQGSFKYLLLQIHWNNIGALDNRTDSSGMRIHYTSSLRQHSGGNVQIGQNQLTIPAQTTNHHVTGSCSSTCTGLMLPHPIFITRVYMHMHDLGISASLKRLGYQGDVLETIAVDEGYNYSSPVVHHFSPGVKVNPGDELQLACSYDSITGSRFRNHNVSFGEGADSEMCYAFISYYPKVLGFDQCLKDDDRDLNCDIHKHQ